MVPDGSLKIDGSVSDNEYGGFAGRYVTPGLDNGDLGNAWILGFENSKEWGGEDDSSFTFWTAHDSEFLYVGAMTMRFLVTTRIVNFGRMTPLRLSSMRIMIEPT